MRLLAWLACAAIGIAASVLGQAAGVEVSCPRDPFATGSHCNGHEIRTLFDLKPEERHTPNQLASVRRLLLQTGTLPTCEFNLGYWINATTPRGVQARFIIANNRELAASNWQLVFRYVDAQAIKLVNASSATVLSPGSTSGAPVRLVDAFEGGAGIDAGASAYFSTWSSFNSLPATGNESLLIKAVNLNGLQCSQLLPSQPTELLDFRSCNAAQSASAGGPGVASDACLAEFCCGYILKDVGVEPPPELPSVPPLPEPLPLPPTDAPPADGDAPPVVVPSPSAELPPVVPPILDSPWNDGTPNSTEDGTKRPQQPGNTAQQDSSIATLAGTAVGVAVALAVCVASTTWILRRRRRAHQLADAARQRSSSAAAGKLGGSGTDARRGSGSGGSGSSRSRNSLGTLTLNQVTSPSDASRHGSDSGRGPSDGSQDRSISRRNPASLPQEVTLFEQLGSGAFGTVYRGEYNGQRVAVKVLITACAPSSRELDSFRQEVAVLSRLRHPNIVAFLAACTVPPDICIIEELAEGGSLHHVLHGRPGERRIVPLPYPRLLQVACDVADAMAYLHPRVVHRDLKAQNVLLDGQGRAKVCDFGIAKFKDRTFVSTVNGQAGTPAYMAPELFDGAQVTEKVDVYSFAILLWEMLTGQVPWANVPSPMQVIYYVGVLQQRPILPEHAPLPLRTLIEGCWAEAPQSRPPFVEILSRLRKMRDGGVAATSGSGATPLHDASQNVAALGECSDSGAIAVRGAPVASTQTAEATFASFSDQALHSYTSSSALSIELHSAPGSPAAVAAMSGGTPLTAPNAGAPQVHGHPPSDKGLPI